MSDRTSTCLVLLGLSAGLLSLGSGCAYPRRSTSLTPAPNAQDVAGAPGDVWQLEFLSGTVPPHQRSGQAWDEDGSGPDPFIRLYRDEELVWESEPVVDSREPGWNVTLPANVRLPSSSSVRIEVWDQDGLEHDPIGIIRSHGLPANALPDALAQLRLDTNAILTMRVHRPVPHRGLGIALYEYRGSSVRVLEVEPESPAGRAGLAAGDQILAVGGASVDELGEARAASALSLAVQERSTLTIKRGDQQLTLEPDRGYTWPTI